MREPGLPAQREQHAAYVAALGGPVTVVPADPALRDCCFIEDTAILDGRRALITRMGREDRRGETTAVRERLLELGFALTEMEAPAALDGGDVLRVAECTYVGCSNRTNEAGIRALRDFLRPAGIHCIEVAVRDCLHLKTACTEVADGVIVLNPDHVDASAFGGRTIVEAVEPDGANGLVMRGVCHLPASAPATVARIRALGIDVRTLDVSSFQAEDGGLTCLSLILR